MLLVLQMSETVEARGIPHARCGSLWSETLMTRSDSSAYPVIARSLKESALSVMGLLLTISTLRLWDSFIIW